MNPSPTAAINSVEERSSMSVTLAPESETIPALPTTTVTANAGPIPMSFPAILRTSGLTERFAHLRIDSASAEHPVKRTSRRDDKEGKRWVRRKENARFIGNPHIVTASKNDFTVPAPVARATFPQPLPIYLSRNTAIPAAVPTAHEPLSANAGRFSLGMKGMRKELRKSGPRTESLVQDVEAEIIGWLTNSVIWLDPGVEPTQSDDILIGTSGSITQVTRTPLQLVWAITDDAFARYVVHCCARYHNIVSFSKDISGQRLTYLLRPNITRPTTEPVQGLYTPPVTDLESSAIDSESDFLLSDLPSDVDLDSDADLGVPVSPPRHTGLSGIPESGPASPAFRPTLDNSSVTGTLDESWSVVNESDADADVDRDLANSVSSLDLDPDLTPRAARQLRQGPLRSHLWERQRRAASSPSRSPARAGRNPPRAIRPLAPKPKTNIKNARPQSFYDYLFA